MILIRVSFWLNHYSKLKGAIKDEKKVYYCGHCPDIDIGLWVFQRFSDFGRNEPRRFDRKGKSIQCYINDVLVIDYPDEWDYDKPVEVGVIALYGVECAFDKFFLQELPAKEK